MTERQKINPILRVLRGIIRFVAGAQWLPHEQGRINYMVKRLEHLYPKLELPTDKSAWDMGHRCLAYMDKALPFRSLLSSSLYQHLFRQHLAGDRRLTGMDVSRINMLFPVCDARIKAFREDVKTDNATIENLKAAGVANCAELAVVARNLLDKQGVNAYHFKCLFKSTSEKFDDKHNFVLFTLPGTPQLKVDEILDDVNNPNVRICDPWFQKCGTVPEMMNYYANTFLMKRGNAYIHIPAGFTMIVEAEHCYPVYDMGVVAEHGNGRVVQLRPKAKNISIPFVTREQENEMIMQSFQYLVKHWGCKAAKTSQKESEGRGARED